MDSLFLDTSFIVALEDEDDQNHHTASLVWHKFKKHPKKLTTSTFIFDETVTVLRRRVSFKKASEVGKKLLKSSLAEIVHVSADDFESAWTLFLKYDDKKLSFTDCVSFAIMRKLSIRNALTFDKHFQQMGFGSICLEL